MIDGYDFLVKRTDLEPYVKDIQASADQEKVALGFIPQNAYENSAFAEKIILAVEADSRQYAGHVYYGGVNLTAKIFQTVVAPKHRATGLAQSLLDYLFKLLEQKGYTTVTAKVASDLVAANKFYSKMGFEKVRVSDGGSTTNRTIFHRVKKLSNPTLFDWNHEGSSTSLVQNLPSNTGYQAPQYLIDLNVIFDVVRQRNNSDHAKAFMAVAHQGLIRVGISEEFIAELNRHSIPGRKDEVLEMASTFQRYALPPESTMKRLNPSLAPIIFTDRSKAGKLTTQDKSDLKHLSSVIENNLDGFITSEKAILKNADFLRREYGIDILSPADLLELIKGEEIDHSPLNTEEFDSQFFEGTGHAAVQRLVGQLKIPKNFKPSSKIKDISHIVVQAKDGEPLAYSWWTSFREQRPHNKAFLWVRKSVSDPTIIADFICDKMARDCSRNGISLIDLELFDSDPMVANSLERTGFYRQSPTHTPNSFKKISIGTALTPKNWAQVRLAICKLTDGLSLPETIPDIRYSSDKLTVTTDAGELIPLTLQKLETDFYPALLVSESMNCVVVPIQPTYSKELLGGHPQLSLLDKKEAILRKERAYFSDPRTNSILRKSSLVLFYESGKSRDGRKAIIALARVRESSVMILDNIGDTLTRQGVLDRSALENISPQNKMTVTIFENIQEFKKPIPFKRLKEIGCVDGTNFVTATTISSKHTISIINEGLLNG